jgi:hypothetical protein
MALLKMRATSDRARPTRQISRKTSWVRANASGYLVLQARLGQRVREGEVLGVLHGRDERAPEGRGRMPIVSPSDGLVIGRSENPLVTVGDALIHIARLG